MSKRDANLAKCTEHDSKQRTIADCLCTRLYQLLLSQDCLWTRLVHLLLSQLSCGRVAKAPLSRKAQVIKEGWVAFQPVFQEGWAAFQQLAFKAGRLFSSWPLRSHDVSPIRRRDASGSAAFGFSRIVTRWGKVRSRPSSLALAKRAFGVAMSTRRLSIAILRCSCVDHGDQQAIPTDRASLQRV